MKLSEELLERVLVELGFNRRPEPSFENLSAIYAAWCQRVPFDNVRKLIHVRSGDAGPLPGSTPDDFFEAWLKHGTGGTCWSGAGACQALLGALGFQAARGVATMLVVPELPPNHGSVLVAFGKVRYLVDCSILHGEPLRFEENVETGVTHPAWGIQCRWRDGLAHVDWRPLHKVDGFECRFERFGASHPEFEQFYAQTRGWSPFNYELSARVNRGDKVVGAGFGQKVILHADGSISQTPMDTAERNRLLIEEIGLSEEIVSLLPADVPTPPPPGSKTAAQSAVAGT